MKLYNTRTRQIEELKPLSDTVRIYSCGPTVYDHIHIGNLSAFTYADMLRRTIAAEGKQVRHVMNFTDVDDKTINRSRDKYPDLSPNEALKRLTEVYASIFMDDMQKLGNATRDAIEFINATDNIEGMRKLITELYEEGYAYVSEDGVYFSIEKYVASGKRYGQLSEITAANTSAERIQNDEYDKDSAHDFALWKKQKPGEPTWEFELDGQDLSGRPGWHIECSVMSVAKLGQPFDIHTGGIDLIFPHHENEIAQSTATNGEVYANVFFHNEHLLVDGKKMSKSLNNFYTLDDIVQKGFSPEALRILILQSHYRNQTQFSWANLEAAQNRLKSYYAMADLRWQTVDKQSDDMLFENAFNSIMTPLSNDLNTPQSLSELSDFQDKIQTSLVSTYDKTSYETYLGKLDGLFGLHLSERKDITDDQKKLIAARQKAREDKDWTTSDTIREELSAQGIALRDTDHVTIWSRL